MEYGPQISLDSSQMCAGGNVGEEKNTCGVKNELLAVDFFWTLYNYQK